MKSLKTTTVTAMVADLEAAIVFYTETLGLELKMRYGDHYAEIDAGNMDIGLHPAESAVKKGNNLSIGFGVTAFDEVVADLEAKGIRLNVIQEGWIRIANFEDPDGNQLFLAELQA
ncbi:MAG: VOC family protein [Acidobacteriota bacterium]|jgi:catechol 2,3-dioxygenase-like lactoylglutathione lyase family enzyme